MAKANRTCKVCGTKYYYCPSCPDELRPSWYGMFHDENCKNIFTILTNHFLGKISKSEARNQLKKCDLTNKDSFDMDTKNQIDELFESRSAKKDSCFENEN